MGGGPLSCGGSGSGRWMALVSVCAVGLERGGALGSRPRPAPPGSSVRWPSRRGRVRLRLRRAPAGARGRWRTRRARAVRICCSSQARCASASSRSTAARSASQTKAGGLRWWGWASRLSSRRSGSRSDPCARPSASRSRARGSDSFPMASRKMAGRLVALAHHDVGARSRSRRSSMPANSLCGWSASSLSGDPVGVVGEACDVAAAPLDGEPDLEGEAGVGVHHLFGDHGEVHRHAVAQPLVAFAGSRSIFLRGSARSKAFQTDSRASPELSAQR